MDGFFLGLRYADLEQEKESIEGYNAGHGHRSFCAISWEIVALGVWLDGLLAVSEVRIAHRTGFLDV